LSPTLLPAFVTILTIVDTGGHPPIFDKPPPRQPALSQVQALSPYGLICTSLFY
jgi:hypothetical protein